MPAFQLMQIHPWEEKKIFSSEMFLSFCCRDHPLPLPRSPWQSINADKTEHHRLHSSYSWISLGRVGCITIPRTSSPARVQWETFPWKVCAWVCLCTASNTFPPPAATTPANCSGLLFSQVRRNNETSCSNWAQQVQHFRLGYNLCIHVLRAAPLSLL